MSIKFDFLQHNGESILITIDENQPSQHIILLDGGCSHPFLDAEQPEINTIIVTHIDHDHINGIIELLEENQQTTQISRILFNEPKSSNLFKIMNNSTQTSISQGNKLQEIIDKTGQIAEHQNDVCFEENNIIEINESTYLQILTPTREVLDTLHNKWNKDAYEQTEDTSTSSTIQSNLKDKSIKDLANVNFEKDNSLSNKSSISFILHHYNHKFLFLGDAHIDEVNKALKSLGYEHNPLSIRFVKISHHGSKKNINNEFLKMIRTNKYIICPTYDEDRKHPSKETIAKIAYFANKENKESPVTIEITKDINPILNFTKKEKEEYNFVIGTIQHIFFD